MKGNITEITTGFHKNILMNLLKELGYRTIKEFQTTNRLDIDGIFGMQSYNTLYHYHLYQ